MSKPEATVKVEDDRRINVTNALLLAMILLFTILSIYMIVLICSQDLSRSSGAYTVKNVALDVPLAGECTVAFSGENRQPVLIQQGIRACNGFAVGQTHTLRFQEGANIGWPFRPTVYRVSLIE